MTLSSVCAVEGAIFLFPLKGLVVAWVAAIRKLAWVEGLPVLGVDMIFTFVFTDRRSTCAGGAHDLLLFSLAFYCNLLTQYDTCAVIIKYDIT